MGLNRFEYGFQTAFGCLLPLAFLAVAAVAFGESALHWLRTGNWVTATVADGLANIGIARPRSEWLGVDKILTLVLSAPLWVITPLVGGLIANWAFSDWAPFSRK